MIRALKSFVGWALGWLLLLALTAIVLGVLYGIAVATGTDGSDPVPTSEIDMEGWEPPD